MVALFAAGEARGSHVNRDCTSADGAIKFHYDSDLVVSHTNFTLMGQETDPSTIEVVPTQTTLQSVEDPMVSITVYAVQWRIGNYLDFVICRAVFGF